MDRPDSPGREMGGYLPLNHRKLPARDKKDNMNKTITFNRPKINIQENQWPKEEALPGFRQTMQDYALAMKNLARRLLPIFAEALDMPCDLFGQAFESPFYRGTLSTHRIIIINHHRRHHRWRQMNLGLLHM